jgi:hypothetical protein
MPKGARRSLPSLPRSRIGSERIGEAKSVEIQSVQKKTIGGMTAVVDCSFLLVGPGMAVYKEICYNIDD